MKKSVFGVLCIVAAGLFGCGENSAPQQNLFSQKKAHLYSLKDGLEYGYERQLSENERKQGQGATEIVMVRYFGERDGNFQFGIKESGVDAVFQCQNPCEFTKVMTFLNGRHLRTERGRFPPETIAGHVMQDIFNKHLERYTTTRNGKTFVFWFNEEKGMQRIEIPESAPSPAPEKK
jgi:hypothetical protein